MSYLKLIRVRGPDFSGVAITLLLGGLILASIPAAKAGTNSNTSISTNTSGIITANANSSKSVPQNLDFSCGYHASRNQTRTVASSSGGSAVKMTIGEPSWVEACNTVSSGTGASSVTFVAYEVFPITIIAGPNVTFALHAATASPTPQQLAIGVYSNTIWTGFNPLHVTTNPDGIARSNFTLAGAVMPFVPNDIANVSLPLEARSSNGLAGSVDLPIEFTGKQIGGVDVIHVLQSPGPIQFEGTMQGSPGNSIQYAYGLVFSPPTSSAGTSPINVSLSVVGSWNAGLVGPLPPSIQVSVVQPRFELVPNQVFYFWVDENNSLGQNNILGSNTYTFAVQEMVGNHTYVEPLSVSMASGGIFASFGAFGSSPASGGTGLPWGLSFDEYLWLIVVALVSVVLVGLVLLHRRKTPLEPSKDFAHSPSSSTESKFSWTD